MNDPLDLMPPMVRLIAVTLLSLAGGLVATAAAAESSPVRASPSVLSINVGIDDLVVPEASPAPRAAMPDIDISLQGATLRELAVALSAITNRPVVAPPDGDFRIADLQYSGSITGLMSELSARLPIGFYDYADVVGIYLVGRTEPVVLDPARQDVGATIRQFDTLLANASPPLRFQRLPGGGARLDAPASLADQIALVTAETGPRQSVTVVRGGQRGNAEAN